MQPPVDCGNIAANRNGIERERLSIDGNEATHDRLRRVAGAHRSAPAAAAHLKAAGISLAANTLITRLWMRELPQALERSLKTSHR